MAKKKTVIKTDSITDGNKERDKAIKRHLTSKWKIVLSFEGHSWCIVPEKPIKGREKQWYDNIGGNSMFIKKDAEHLVRLHNEHIDRIKKKKWKK